MIEFQTQQLEIIPIKEKIILPISFRDGVDGGSGKPEEQATNSKNTRGTSFPTGGYKAGDFFTKSDDNEHTYIANEDLDWVSIRDGTIVAAAGTANWSEIVDDDANKPESNADKTSENQADIDGSNINNDSGWTDDTAADAARTVADNAQSDAIANDALLDDIAADDKITPVEKLTLKPLWDAVVAEKSDIDTQADTYSVSKTNYGTAYTTLNTYLNTTIDVFANMTTTSTIARATWDSAWEGYFNEKIEILNAIADAVTGVNETFSAESDINVLLTTNAPADAGATDDTAADAAQGTANIRITTFYQSGIPTSLAAGDFWIDTDDGKAYRATGIGDTTIEAGKWIRIDLGLYPGLINVLNTTNAPAVAGATDDTAANLRITTFYQSAIPTSLAAGDMWLDTDDGKLYRATGIGDTTIEAGKWIRIDTGLYPGLIDALQTTNAPADAGATEGADLASNVSNNVVDNITAGRLYATVVDAAGNGDYTSLNAAITAGKKNIFIRNGTYTLSSSLNISSNTTIIGESTDGVIIDIDSNNYFFNILGSSSTYSVGTISINNSTTALTGIGTSWDGNVTADHYVDINGVLYEIASVNTDTSITLVDTYRGNTMTSIDYFAFIPKINIQISNLTIINGGNISVMFIGQCDDIYIHNIVFGGGNGLGVTIGSATIPVYGVTFENNIISNFTQGMLAGGSASNSNILNNYIYNCGVNGMTLGTEAKAFNIINNLIVNCEIGIGFGPSVISSLISNNIITNCNVYGINISETTAIDNLIIGNIIKNNGDDAPDNIYIGSNDLNIIKNNTGVTVNEEQDYKTMKNTDGDAMAVGDLVILKSVANGNEVIHTTAQGDDNVYGMALETIANNAWGKIMILGKTINLKVDGTDDIAIGDFIGTFTTEGIGAKAGAGDMAIAKALEGYTFNDSSGVINALLITPRKI